MSAGGFAQTDALRGMVATMLLVSPSEVGDATSLATLNTSLGSARMRLALKRLGLALPAGAAPATYGGLVAALSGAPAAAAPVSASQSFAPVAAEAASGAPVPSGANLQAGNGAVHVGLDVEAISSLPSAADYWEQEFYRASFARSEIAYAVLQAEPRIHFAGFWCAKEALRKCDSSFAGVDPSQTAVAHDGDGRPYLTAVDATVAATSGLRRLPHVVSISHAGDVATAVVVLAAPALAEKVVATAAAELTAGVSALQDASEKRKPRGLAKLFGI